MDGAGTTTNGIYINATTTAITYLTISNLTINRYTFAGIYGYGQHSGGLQHFTVDNCRFTDFQRAGYYISGLNNLANNHNIVVQNSYFDDDDLYTDQSDGIYAQVLTSFTADNNYILLDSNYLGIADLHSDNIQSFLVDNVTYSNNIVIKTSPNKTLGTQMLFTEDGNGVHTMYNNLLIRNAPYAEDSAIRIKGSAQTGIVYSNSYYGFGPTLNSSPIADIKNNIFYGLGQPVPSTAFVRSLVGSTISNNLYYDPNGQFPAPTGGTETNPLFVDTNFASVDMHLQRTSPAINAGLNLGETYNSDIDETLRDLYWDIGTYEYVPLTVTINQAVGQSDPTTTSPVNFTVVFSESVSDFTSSDVTLTGTAGATTVAVSGSGTTYSVAVSGMTSSGTVIASILADRASGETSNTNVASTSTDNTITYDISAPIGGSITYADGSYSTIGVRLTVNDGADSDSGIDTTTRTVQRQSATSNSGVCSTYGDFATISPDGTYPDYVDSTVVTDNCYIYRYLVSDNLGNQATYTSSSVFMVDTSVPIVLPGQDSFAPTTTSPPSSSNTGVSSRSCSDSAPPAPELFQADVRGNSTKLFFTPLLDTNKFFISYSTNANAEEHGVEVSLAREGVQNYTINMLKPADTYYFKIRGQNGCASGPWSNILVAKTGYPKALRAISYYMNSLVTKTTAILKSSQSPRTPITTTPRVVITPTPTLQPVQMMTQDPSIATPPSKPKVRTKLCFLWWCF